jgi:hypothetical protein
MNHPASCPGRYCPIPDQSARLAAAERVVVLILADNEEAWLAVTLLRQTRQPCSFALEAPMGRSHPIFVDI